jgi:hypothetical protein
MRCALLIKFGKLARCADFCREVELLTVEAVKRTEFRLADARCVRQNHGKYRLKVSRRRVNDIENLRGTGQLFQRLVTLAGET